MVASYCVIIFNSTAKSAQIKERVRQLFQQNSKCFGDFTLTSFDDPFLQENLVSLSVVDTEFLHRDQVIF